MTVPRDDLFRLLPELPWFRRPSREDAGRARGAGVEEWRDRALKNIERQRAAAAEVKKRLASRTTRAYVAGPRRTGGNR